MIDVKEDCPLRLQSEKLLVEEVLNELMIVDPARDKAFSLNQTAAFVWKQSDGKTPVAEIAKRLAQHLDKPVNEQVVWFTLDMLSKDGLLGSAAVLPPVHSGVTRRHLLQKMGVGAMALPVVSVLVLSPAKAHASSAPAAASNVPAAASQNAPSSAAQPDPGDFWKWLEDFF